MSSDPAIDENCEDTGTQRTIQNVINEMKPIHEVSHPHKDLFNKVRENDCVLNTTVPPTRQRRPSLQLDISKDDIRSNASMEEQKEEGQSILKFRSLSGKQKLLVILCLLAYFMEGVAYSLLAPLFPEVAAEKGMSITISGFVFSVYMLVSFLTVPIYGSCMTTLGPKFVFMSGIFVAGVCTVLIGNVDMCPPGTWFTVITLLCRIIGALGFSAYITALLSIIVNEFSKDVTTVFAIFETANGVGYMVGPSIGGLLFELGGFGLPFYVTGVTILLCGPLGYSIFPKSEIPERKKMSRWRLLKSPLVVIGMLSIVIGSAGHSYLEPTLANHLKPFNLSVAVIGLIFVINPCIYAVSSPLWGYITDRLGVYRHAMTIGQFVFGLSFFFIGPSRLLPFLPYKIWTIVTGLVISGMSMGSFLVPPMKLLVIGARDVGLGEDIDTYSVVSGVYLSMYFMGTFIGPSMSGFLVNEFGAAYSFTVIGMSNIFMSVIELIFFSTDYLLTLRRKKSILSNGNSSTHNGQSVTMYESTS